MSASGSPLPSNTRIDPAVAAKLRVRPGRSSVCFVVASGGRRRASAADGEACVTLCALLLRPPFCPAADAASARGCGGSSARATPESAIADTASTRLARRSVCKFVAMIFLPARL